jgi:antitoxin PrlF
LFEAKFGWGILALEINWFFAKVSPSPENNRHIKVCIKHKSYSLRNATLAFIWISAAQILRRKSLAETLCAYYNVRHNWICKERAMSTAIVSTKGQIVIPVGVRAAMGLTEGSRVEFVETPDGWIVKPAVTSVHSLKGVLRKPARKVSIDDMDRAVRTRAQALQQSSQAKRSK